MNFGAMQARVAQETGLSVTDDATMIQAWLNGAYQQLSGFFDWPWLLTNFTLQTVADITNLTATVNAGASSVTLSSTVTPSLATNYYIKLTDTTQGGTSDWYQITAHSAGTNALTLSVPFVGASNYVTGSCKIRKVYYSLPSTIDRLSDLRQSVTKQKIELIDKLTFDKMVPDPDNTGTPTYAYLTGIDSSANWQMSFYPLPSSIVNIQGRGYRKVVEMASDVDVSLVPEKWSNVIVFLALALYGHDYIDDSRVATAQARAKEIVQEMMKEFNPFPGEFHVIQPWDTRTPRGLLGVRLPSNFPWPYGI